MPRWHPTENGWRCGPSEVYVFAMDSAIGRPVANRAPTSCVILGLDEKQGEGVGWWWDSRRLVLTSEGQNAPLFVITCAMPAPDS
jgi:hypothetical protein